MRRQIKNALARRGPFGHECRPMRPPFFSSRTVFIFYLRSFNLCSIIGVSGRTVQMMHKKYSHNHNPSDDGYRNEYGLP
jgi:hypothetical protein